MALLVIVSERFINSPRSTGLTARPCCLLESAQAGSRSLQPGLSEEGSVDPHSRTSWSGSQPSQLAGLRWT